MTVGRAGKGSGLHRDGVSGVRRMVVLGSVVLLTLSPALLGALPTLAGSPATPTRFTASDGNTSDLFGRAVAIDGNRVLVGAPEDDDRGGDSGSAYLYEPDGQGGWTELKFVGSDTTGLDGFGHDVALEGGRILVGAPGDDDAGSRSGAAYLYEEGPPGTWTESKFVASDASADALLGISVAIDGETVVVGAYLDSVSPASGGSVYVYRPDGAGGWSETKLTPSDGAAGDFFGVGVDVSGDRIIVGAHFDDDAGSASGSAYIFDHDDLAGWTETKLTPSDGAAGDFFGTDVAIHGDRALVGAPADDDLGPNSGSAYLFEWDGASWSETKLAASDGQAGDVFGRSVALSSDLVVIGAPDPSSTGPGALYAYRPDGSGGWTETRLSVAGAVDHDLGFGVAAGPSRALGGAPGENNEHGVNAGAAYLFDRTQEPTDETQDDGGTGGDASDDPDDPTPQESDTVAGQVSPATDEADWWGTEVDAGVADELCFTLTVPNHQDLRLELHAPDGSTVLSVDAGGLGDDEALCYAPGGKLDPGTWSAGVVHVPLTDVSAGSSTPGFGGLDYILGRDCKPTCVST